ncbi:MAG: cob(I)yrinic acid a,c-diamide adenosyltransferase [Gammaproteobacteria bacterium]|jgi:cob(I)alamin adenosyltransferase|nr:cob(I)yrinic acid a,c-diamide adenosyltransferase [Gammaproteobacteria bacterium]
MGHRISKVYTKTGDDGLSGLADGTRLPKSHPRFEAMGALDQLNSQLGLLLAFLQQEVASKPKLQQVIDALIPWQHILFDLGGELAMPQYQVVQSEHTTQLEQQIDHWTSQLAPLKDFILPGGSILIAQAHLCRCEARTAERRCQQLHRLEPMRTEVLAFVNRLSDLFFVAARIIALHQGCSEVLWQAQPAPQA